MFSISNVSKFVTKKKDSELNKIRRTFKRKSREAVDIESIVNEKEIIKSQLKEAEVKIGELADSNESKEEALEHLKNKLKNMSNSNKQLQRRLSTISEDIDLDNCQLTGRTQMLEEVTKERDLLKRQLKDLAGLEALLKQLKKRAERSFLLENENEDLIKELNVL